MKKVISYCLFQMPDTERWLFYTYFRGLIWNVKMCAVIYPYWEIRIHVDAKTFSEFNNIFFGLHDIYGCKIDIQQPMPLCKFMLTRLMPIFDDEVEYCLCRDSDAITTYREALSVQQWIKEDKPDIMTLKDNSGHTLPLMGGLSNYKCELIRQQYGSWDSLLNQINIPLDTHGSDQRLLMETIGTRFKNFIKVVDMREVSKYEHPKLESVNEELWLSNLCCWYIGEAGINNMEYLRLEKRFLKNDAMEQIEKSYPNVFYQYQL